MEHTLTMTDPAERKTRDQTIKTALADPETRHHEIVAETELNIDYAQSPIVFGEANGSCAAGYRLPDDIPVRTPEGAPSKLHALGHRAGNTLIFLSGPAANPSAWLALHAALQDYVKDSTLFETVVALARVTTTLTKSVRSSPPRRLAWGLKEAHSSPSDPTATSACAPTKTTWLRCKATPLPSKPPESAILGSLSEKNTGRRHGLTGFLKLMFCVRARFQSGHKGPW